MEKGGRALLPPHLTVPLTQRDIHVRRRSSGTGRLSSPLGTPLRLQHLNPTLQQLLDLVFPPFCFFLLNALYNLPHFFLLVAMLVRLAVPALLELVCCCLLQSALDEGVFFEDLEVVFVGGEEGGEERFGAEFEDDDGEEDDEQAEPPGEGCAEPAQEGVAHVVDCAAGVVGCGQDDVPEEPTADGAEDCDAVCDCFGVCFDEPVTLLVLS